MYQNNISTEAIDLNNPDHIRFDRSGKTEAFFCKKNMPISQDTINSLLLRLKKCDSTRLCLHKSPESKMHGMLIAQNRSTQANIEVHMHVRYEEIYHMVRGVVRINIYSNQRKITDSYILDTEGNSIFIVEKNIYHSVEILSEHAVYFESKPGPFDREIDITY